MNIVRRYAETKRLSRLGYKFDAGDLSATDAEGFLIIDQVIDKLNDKKSKADTKRQGSRGNSQNRPTSKRS